MKKSTLKITSKGQITFRKVVLDQLGVRPGDGITVEVVGDRRLEIRPARPIEGCKISSAR